MEILLISSAFAIGFIMVLISIPPILRVAKAKKLYDAFDERKIHRNLVPPLGGVAIFIGFIFATILTTNGYNFVNFRYIALAVILLFFIGLKDDLIIIPARKKLIVQIMAALLIITFGDVRISSFHGIFGINNIHYITSLLFTILIVLAIVNAYNLVDGIDGLASGLGILASSFFGVWFCLTGHIQFSVMSFALAGSLAGFFLYNVFGHKNKLFMGDTGSLVLGLLVSVMVIQFNEFNIENTSTMHIIASPSVSFAVIVVPLIDMLRVMTIRISNGKSPFAPDKNHFHHRLLTVIPSHLKVTLIIISINAFIIGLALLLNYFSFHVTLQFLFIFLTGSVILSLISKLMNKIEENKKLKIYSPVRKPLKREANMDQDR